MTVELSKPRNIVLNNTVYQVESYDIHNHIKYANALRWLRGRFINVEDFEIRKNLGRKLN